MKKFVIGTVCLLSVSFSAYFAKAQTSIVNVGSGIIQGDVSIVPMDKEYVKSLLIPELELQDMSPNQHPVVTMMNDYPEANLSVSKVPLKYREFVLMIPHVQFKGAKNSRPFIYWVKLYLDSPTGIEAGTKLYGYPKEYADFSFNGEAKAASREGQNLVSVTSSSEKNELSLVTDSQTRTLIDEALNSPIVSKKADGTIVCSLAPLDLETLSVKAESQIVKYHVDVAPGLKGKEVSVEPLNSTNFGFGGFEIKGKWTLSKPYSCDEFAQK